jgi:1-deoxy-D-xylulose-5-phosphate synthase
MKAGVGLSGFAEEFPSRFFDVGIAEAHAAVFAAGLAIGGRRPFFYCYSSFLQRAYDQIVTDIAFQKLPVTFMIDRAGSVGADGETHHGLFDLSYLGHIPNVKIFAPNTEEQLFEYMNYALHQNEGPIAIRYPKGVPYDLKDWIAGQARNDTNINHEIVSQAYNDAMHANGQLLGDAAFTNRVIAAPEPQSSADGSSAISIVAEGPMVAVAVQAANILKKEGVGVRVVDISKIKPLDVDRLEIAAEGVTHIVTLEDNVKSGGLGERVLEYFAGSRTGLPRSARNDNHESLAFPTGVHEMGTFPAGACPQQIRVHIMAWPDEFITHGSVDELRRLHGLDADGVCAKIREIMHHENEIP